MSLLTTDQLRALDGLVVRSRSVVSSPMPGRRTGAGTGFSVEFADYRSYNPGDDLRYVDWNLYARLGRLFLRVFRAEAELTLHILLDTSASMRFGRSDKFAFASRLAAALAFVGVSNLDRVRFATFADGLGQVLPPVRDRAQLFHVLELIEHTTPEGRSDLNRSLREYGEAAWGGGVVAVLSDCFDPAGLADGLGFLALRRFDVNLIHVLADEEFDPDPSADRVIDIEDPDLGEVNVDPDRMAAYRDRFEAWLTDLERMSMLHGVNYMRAASSTDFEDWVLQFLRSGIWHA